VLNGVKRIILQINGFGVRVPCPFILRLIKNVSMFNYNNKNEKNRVLVLCGNMKSGYAVGTALTLRLQKNLWSCKDWSFANNLLQWGHLG
jgi:hypothetical protein